MTAENVAAVLRDAGLGILPRDLLLRNEDKVDEGTRHHRFDTRDARRSARRRDDVRPPDADDTVHLSFIR